MSRIDISINMPDKINDDYKYKSLYEKVCDYIVVCESDEDSYYHWNYLKSLYEKLSKVPTTNEAIRPVLEKLEPFILKHRTSDSGETVDVDAQNMFKQYGDD